MKCSRRELAHSWSLKKYVYNCYCHTFTVIYRKKYHNNDLFAIEQWPSLMLIFRYSTPQAGGSSGLLMDLAANEKDVHADFFNSKSQCTTHSNCHCVIGANPIDVFFIHFSLRRSLRWGWRQKCRLKYYDIKITPTINYHIANKTDQINNTDFSFCFLMIF